MVKLTKEMLTSGRSKNGGWSKPQLALLGVTWPPKKGWLLASVGMIVSQQVADEFLALKDRHLDTLDSGSKVFTMIDDDYYSNMRMSSESPAMDYEDQGNNMRYQGLGASIACTEQQDDLIAECIGRAIRHAQRVCVREHIKADRIERVNHLITSLRREVSYLEGQKLIPAELRQYVSNILLQRGHWHDIGITTSAGHNVIGNWLAKSKRQSHSASAQSEMILADLEELERGLVGFQQSVHEAERINKEGDVIVAQLCEVFQ